MKYNNLKWIVSILVSVGIGTFIMDILENIDINVWVARTVGILAAIIVELVFNHIWFSRTKK